MNRATMRRRPRVPWGFVALATLLVAVSALGCHPASAAADGADAADGGAAPLRAGDIVFQTSTSKQSAAIQHATHSPFTHVGMIVHADGKLAVFEAEGTVHTTPLEAWIARAPASFVARRLKDAASLLTTAGQAKLVTEGRKHMGKPYDAAFDWSDEKMYCSELVWKSYHEALGIDLGAPRPLRSFALTSAGVHAALVQRYGKSIPLDAPMISPQQIFESDLLETVRDDRKN